MANIVPNSFKSGLLKGTFNFDTSGNGGNTFKCALYTSISSYSVASTVYLAGTSNGEVSSSGTAYSAGGNTLTNEGIAGTTTAYVDFQDLTFPSVTLTAAGAAIYKTTGGGNELVLVCLTLSLSIKAIYLILYYASPKLIIAFEASAVGN